MQPQIQNTLKNVFLRAGRGHRNDGPLASMLESWFAKGAEGNGYLGLNPLSFREFMRFQFPGYPLRRLPQASRQHSMERILEWNDVKRYLLKNRAWKSHSEVWIAEMIASACLGLNHLWQDLGVHNRGELSALLENNFPKLARRNRHNMKWKKFIYRELCQTEGIYVCRSPSCDVCVDYQDCFGSEEA